MLIIYTLAHDDWRTDKHELEALAREQSRESRGKCAHFLDVKQTAYSETVKTHWHSSLQYHSQQKRALESQTLPPAKCPPLLRIDFAAPPSHTLLHGPLNQNI